MWFHKFSAFISTALYNLSRQPSQQPICRAWQLHAQKSLQQTEVHSISIRPCTRAWCGYRLNIGSPRVSYYINGLGAPQRARYARRAMHPPFFTLHVRDLIESAMPSRPSFLFTSQNATNYFSPNKFKTSCYAFYFYHL